MNVESVIYAKQKHFGYIQSVNFQREIEGTDIGRFDIELSLVQYPNETGEVFRILFEGVCNLKLNSIDNMLKVCIFIRDISASQCEGVHYYVCDVENELFSFSCLKISII